MMPSQFSRVFPGPITSTRATITPILNSVGALTRRCQQNFAPLHLSTLLGLHTRSVRVGKGCRAACRVTPPIPSRFILEFHAYGDRAPCSPEKVAHFNPEMGVILAPIRQPDGGPTPYQPRAPTSAMVPQWPLNGVCRPVTRLVGVKLKDEATLADGSTASHVKLLLPPRQSRGNSYFGLGHRDTLLVVTDEDPRLCRRTVARRENRSRRGVGVATRNADAFEGSGIRVIDPWQAPVN